MPHHDKRIALATGGNRGIGDAISRSRPQGDITVIVGVRESRAKIKHIRAGRKNDTRPTSELQNRFRWI